MGQKCTQIMPLTRVLKVKVWFCVLRLEFCKWLRRHDSTRWELLPKQAQKVISIQAVTKIQLSKHWRKCQTVILISMCVVLIIRMSEIMMVSSKNPENIVRTRATQKHTEHLHHPVMIARASLAARIPARKYRRTERACARAVRPRSAANGS